MVNNDVQCIMDSIHIYDYRLDTTAMREPKLESDD